MSEADNNLNVLVRKVKDISVMQPASRSYADSAAVPKNCGDYGL